MSVDLPQQIDACKRRMRIVAASIEAAKAKGEASTEEERQIMLEAELLRLLEARLAVSDVTCGRDSL